MMFHLMFHVAVGNCKLYNPSRLSQIAMLRPPCIYILFLTTLLQLVFWVCVKVTEALQEQQWRTTLQYVGIGKTGTTEEELDGKRSSLRRIHMRGFSEVGKLMRIVL